MNDIYRSRWDETGMYCTGCMQWEDEMAALAFARWSATTHTLTNGCCVHRWQSDVVALVLLHVMGSCMLLEATTRQQVIRHQVALIALNGTDIFTWLHWQLALIVLRLIIYYLFVKCCLLVISVMNWNHCKDSVFNMQDD